MKKSILDKNNDYEDNMNSIISLATSILATKKAKENHIKLLLHRLIWMITEINGKKNIRYISKKYMMD